MILVTVNFPPFKVNNKSSNYLPCVNLSSYNYCILFYIMIICFALCLIEVNSYCTWSYFAVGPGQSCLSAAACRLSILYSSARTCSIMDLCLIPDAVSTSPILHFAFMYRVNCDWIVNCAYVCLSRCNG